MTRFLALGLLLLLILVHAQPAFTADPASSETLDRVDRGVDQAALGAQEAAMSRITALIQKYRGTRQEPVLLFKLAELQTQAASYRFRIAHGAQTSHRDRELAEYRKTLQQATRTLSDFLAKDPESPDSPKAWFLRGKAFEELDDKASATRDFEKIVRSYPDSEPLIPASLSLADFAIAANDPARAIGHLERVEKHPDDPQLPFALYKLAWAHYNLKHIPLALEYVEKHVARADPMFRENMLQDATLFFMQGLEDRVDGYSVASALERFRKLDQGPALGKMLVRFAKLLRSHGREQELDQWKELVLARESDRPESLEVVLTVFENQLNRRRFQQLPATARDLVPLAAKHPGFEGFPRAQKLLIDTAEQLQQILVKNHEADGVSVLAEVLAGIYDTFTRIVPEQDARIPRVHYNLAETLFAIRDFEGATRHYRWVAEHRPPGPLANSALKAIASRYESLKQLGLIPGTLQARSAQAPASNPALPPLLSEWIGWVDEQRLRDPQSVGDFLFESNRCLYAQGLVAQALARLRSWVDESPASPVAVTSATLILDSWIVAQDWEEVHRLGRTFLKNPAWKKGPFGERLLQIAADARARSIQRLLESHDFARALELGDDFVDQYPQSARIPDVLLASGHAAVALDRPELARQKFTALIEGVGAAGRTKDTPALAPALLARATLHEGRFRAAEAAQDLDAAFRVTPANSGAEADRLRRKSLLLAWISGQMPLLQRILGNGTICTPGLAVECDRFQALLRLQLPQPGTEPLRASLESAREGPELNRALWAAVVLENSGQLSFRDRLRALRILAKGWESLDALTRFALLPRISVSVPQSMAQNRKDLEKQWPLRANSRAITQRIEAIREVESTATQAMKLPWARVRAQLLAESAGLYLDLSRGLGKLPSPKGLSDSERVEYEQTVSKLVIPFEEKGQEMQAQAFAIASTFAIEDEAFLAVAAPFLQDNPSQAKALKPAQAPGVLSRLDLEALIRMDAPGNWNRLAPDSEDPLPLLKAHWADALRLKQWAKVAYLVQEATDRKLIPGSGLALMRAVSLAQAGARGEALAEIAEARKDLPPEARKQAVGVLLSHSLRACSKARTREWLDEAYRLDPEAALKLKITPPASAMPQEPLAQVLYLAEQWLRSS